MTKKQIRLNVRNIKRGIYAHYISVKWEWPLSRLLEPVEKWQSYKLTCTETQEKSQRIIYKEQALTWQNDGSLPSLSQTQFLQKFQCKISETVTTILTCQMVHFPNLLHFFPSIYERAHVNVWKGNPVSKIMVKQTPCLSEKFSLPVKLISDNARLPIYVRVDTWHVSWPCGEPRCQLLNRKWKKSSCVKRKAFPAIFLCAIQFW